MAQLVFRFTTEEWGEISECIVYVKLKSAMMKIGESQMAQSFCSTEIVKKWPSFKFFL